MNPGGLIGETPRMKEIFELVRKIAPLDAPVLILGESGTGKESIARAIRELSQRSKELSPIFNCATVPEPFLEGQLFGYEKGAYAYAGAHEVYIGPLEQADGGTAILKEIQALSLQVQIQLLSFLQDKTFERIGSHKSLTADVRVISTSSKELNELIVLGEFREDLYYRMAVFEMKMPPLRERMEDLPLLADAFLKEVSASIKRKIVGIDSAAMEVLTKYGWPGNVRELRNVLEYAAVKCSGDQIERTNLPLQFFLKEEIASAPLQSGKRWELED